MMHVPGSEGYVGGPLMSLYLELDPCRVVRDWRCVGVYMNVPYEVPHPYCGPDCAAVLYAVHEATTRQPALAASVLLDGERAPGQPLPGWFTVQTDKGRVDLRVSHHLGKKHLMALLYRGAYRRSPHPNTPTGILIHLSPSRMEHLA
jgi:hypothetical protein